MRGQKCPPSRSGCRMWSRWRMANKRCAFFTAGLTRITPTFSGRGFASEQPSCATCVMWHASLRGVSAIDGNVRARDIRGGVGGEEDDDPAQVVLVGHAVEERSLRISLDEHLRLP